jgi:hypothetical protein
VLEFNNSSEVIQVEQKNKSPGVAIPGFEVSKGKMDTKKVAYKVFGEQALFKIFF